MKHVEDKMLYIGFYKKLYLDVSMATNYQFIFYFFENVGSLCKTCYIFLLVIYVENTILL